MRFAARLLGYTLQALVLGVLLAVALLRLASISAGELLFRYQGY